MEVSARDDYPVLAAFADGFLPHQPEGREAVAVFAEIDRLRQWQFEASAVLARWDDVAARFDMPIGALKSESVGREIDRLQTTIDMLRDEVRRLGGDPDTLEYP